METLEQLLNKLPTSLYKGGLYMKHGNGIWYVGYEESVHHTSDKDLRVALSVFCVKLKTFGYIF